MKTILFKNAGSTFHKSAAILCMAIVISLGASAQTTTNTAAPSTEVKSDMKDLRKEVKDIKADRKDVREDGKELRDDRKDVREDGKELKDDRKDFRTDKKEFTENKKEFRGDAKDVKTLEAERKEARKNGDKEKAKELSGQIKTQKNDLKA